MPPLFSQRLRRAFADVQQQHSFDRTKLTSLHEERYAKLLDECAELTKQIALCRQEIDSWQKFFEEEFDREIWQTRTQFESRLIEDIKAKKQFDHKYGMVLSSGDVRDVFSIFFAVFFSWLKSSV